MIHHDDAVGELQRLLLIVGDEDRGQAHAIVQIAQPAAQILADLGVERAERLVEQQDARLDRERAGQRDALALAAGKLRRIALAEPAELDEIEQFLDAARDLGLGRARSRRLRTVRPKATLSATVMWRNSAYCWKTKPTPRSVTGWSVTSSPSNATVPASGNSSPAMIRSSVVLPEPEGPSSARNSPGRASRSMSPSAVKLPKRFADAGDRDAHQCPLPPR